MPKQTSYDADRVLFAFKKMPDVFAEEMDYWLNRERIGFLGRKKKRDSTSGIKGKLYHKETAAGFEGWPNSIVEKLTSFKNDAKTMHSQLVMGAVGNNAKANKVLELFETGGKVQGDWMIIPNIKVLKYFGIYKQDQALEYFKENIKNFRSVKSKTGSIVYLLSTSGIEDRKARQYGKGDKNGGNIKNQDYVRAFTAKREAKIKRQYKFQDLWNKRLPKIMHRGQVSMDRATRKIEKMIKEGDIL